jgi:AcrR family transcriptional regulator
MSEFSPRAQATRRRVIDCLFELMAERPIEQIRIVELCALAHINRSTFYNHFCDIYDVREKCEDEIIEVAQSLLPALMKGVVFEKELAPVQSIVLQLEPCAEYLNILLNGGDPEFLVRLRAVAYDALLEILPIKRFSERQEYVFDAIVDMESGLIGRWLANGRSLPLSDLLIIIRMLIWHGPRNVLLRV